MPSQMAMELEISPRLAQLLTAPTMPPAAGQGVVKVGWGGLLWAGAARRGVWQAGCVRGNMRCCAPAAALDRHAQICKQPQRRQRPAGRAGASGRQAGGHPPVMSTHTTDSLPKRQPTASSARDTNRKASLPASGTVHQLKLSAGRAGRAGQAGTYNVLKRSCESCNGREPPSLQLLMASAAAGAAAGAATVGDGWHQLTHAPA
jgi:hypothetical protein